MTSVFGQSYNYYGTDQLIKLYKENLTRKILAGQPTCTTTEIKDVWVINEKNRNFSSRFTMCGWLSGHAEAEVNILELNVTVLC